MARKVGEVKAFCVLGAELFEKGESALTPAFGESVVSETIEKLKLHTTKIDEAMDKTEFGSVMNEKAEKTKAKVGGMADTYIGEAWDDATELCEWLGFFEGAAIVHFSLVSGFAKKNNLLEIESLAHEGMILHQELLALVAKTIPTLA